MFPSRPGQEGDRPGRTIASNNDKTIGSLIAEAMEKVGKDGVITVEESKSAGHGAGRGRGYAVRPRYLSPTS